MTTKKCLRTAGKDSSKRIVEAAAEVQRRGVTPRLRECISGIERQAGVAAWAADYCLAERGQP